MINVYISKTTKLWYNNDSTIKGENKMSQNLYDTANQLERELRQSPEYTALKDAFAAINADEEAKKIFEEFRLLTVKFQQMQMTNQEPTEEDIKQAQESAKVAQENEKVLALMKAEQAMSVLMEDLNRVITQPLAQIYQEQ